MLLQNAFIRIQFLEKFKYFCPYLKWMLHSDDLNAHHLRRNPRMQQLFVKDREKENPHVFQKLNLF
jgi:hypothetical protein